MLYSRDDCGKHSENVGTVRSGSCGTGAIDEGTRVDRESLQGRGGREIIVNRWFQPDLRIGTGRN